MGRRVRELEQEVARKDNEIAQLRQRLDELGAALEKYRLQESAIAGALTRAQAAADRTIREAQEEKQEILLKANAGRLEAQTEAAGIVADAERRADIIEKSAKENAHETAFRAEAFMTQYRVNAEKLIREFKRTAQEASKQATVFADYMNGINLDEAVEITREYDHISAMAQTPAQDMPDDYVDPASLMRSIYAIEHRDMPQQGTEVNREPIPEIENEPVPELIPPGPETVPEPAPEYEPIPAPEPEKTLDVAPETARVTDPFTSWIRPGQATEQTGQPQGKTAWVQDAVDLGSRDDSERVWTVEEIVERTNANENAQIDEELNAIIEDVLRGS